MVDICDLRMDCFGYSMACCERGSFRSKQDLARRLVGVLYVKDLDLTAPLTSYPASFFVVSADTKSIFCMELERA